MVSSFILISIKKFIPLFAVLWGLPSCRSQKPLAVQKLDWLRFIGEYILPGNTRFKDTKVGELSSIDYDPADVLYYFISDARSEYNAMPDILAINNHQLLVTERFFSTSYLTCNISVCNVELNEAEDISGTASLSATPPKNALPKKLL